MWAKISAADHPPVTDGVCNRDSLQFATAEATRADIPSLSSLSRTHRSIPIQRHLREAHPFQEFLIFRERIELSIWSRVHYLHR